VSRHSLFFRPSNLLFWAALSLVLLRGALTMGRKTGGERTSAT
jgi:hypothetical protein